MCDSVCLLYLLTSQPKSKNAYAPHRSTLHTTTPYLSMQKGKQAKQSWQKSATTQRALSTTLSYPQLLRPREVSQLERGVFELGLHDVGHSLG